MRSVESGQGMKRVARMYWIAAIGVSASFAAALQRGATTLSSFVSYRHLQMQETSNPSAFPTAVSTAVPTVPAMGNNNGNTNDSSSQTSQSTTETQSFTGGSFCQAPLYQSEDPYQEACPWQTYEYADPDIMTRGLTGECGPQCRPSCITLLLDLEKLSLSQDLKCSQDEFCQCDFVKNMPCTTNETEAVLGQYPMCDLEYAQCLGPTLFDDSISYMESVVAKIGASVPDIAHCTAIPDEEVYCRFRDWPLVSPMEWQCSNNECVDDPTKIYFEYCNIVEEKNCDQCDDQKCSTTCDKVVEPFPPGWTSFVVTASIPYFANVNSDCDSILDYESVSDDACFLQRIDLYYPPLNATCELGCPHCHDCPLVELGDTFGPLEVVGFGNCLQNNNNYDMCACCDQRDYKKCSCQNQNCDSNFGNCDSAVDCYDGGSLGLPDFVGNDCSYVTNSPAVSPSYASGGTTQPYVYAGATAANQDSTSHKRTGIIAAFSTIGGQVALAAILLLVVTVYRRRRREHDRATHDTTNQSGGAEQAPVARRHHHRHNRSSDFSVYETASISHIQGAEEVETTVSVASRD